MTTAQRIGRARGGDGGHACVHWQSSRLQPWNPRRAPPPVRETHPPAIPLRSAPTGAQQPVQHLGRRRGLRRRRRPHQPARLWCGRGGAGVGGTDGEGASASEGLRSGASGGLREPSPVNQQRVRVVCGAAAFTKLSAAARLGGRSGSGATHPAHPYAGSTRPVPCPPGRAGIRTDSASHPRLAPAIAAPPPPLTRGSFLRSPPRPNR